MAARICAQTEPLLIKLPVKVDNGGLIRPNELILAQPLASSRSLLQPDGKRSKSDSCESCGCAPRPTMHRCF